MLVTTIKLSCCYSQCVLVQTADGSENGNVIVVPSAPSEVESRYELGGSQPASFGGIQVSTAALKCRPLGHVNL